MRGTRTITAVVTALALIAGGLVMSAPAVAASTAPTPVVQGNKLVDSRNGSTFIPRGVNWPGFEYACWQGWGYSGGYSQGEATAIASWHANVVRVPLNQDCWLGLNGTPKGSGRTAAGYQASVRGWVDQLNAAGLVVILDLHSSAPAGYKAEGQRAMADAQSLTFWTQVAAAYKTVPSVMFDLFNEPYSRWQGDTEVFDMTWLCWKNGGCQAPVEDDYTSGLSGAKFSTVGMDQLVSTVRATGAAQPLLLGGLNYSNDLSGWLANKPTDSQLVVAWHAYPGQGVDTLAEWNAQVAPIAATVPVVIGEFGQTDGSTGYFTALMDWADAHGVGYLPWAWWDVPASESLTNSRYALFEGAAFTPKAPIGTVYHDHLFTVGGFAPPRSTISSFVTAAYQDVLSRDPEPSGITYWEQALGNGTPRSAVAGSFNNSDEYRLLKIDAAYDDVLGRAAEPSGRAFWLDQMRRGLVQPDDVHRTFLSMSEFYSVQGGGTDGGYISALYLDVVGRPVDAGGASYWNGVLRAGGRIAVVDGLWFAPETYQRRVSVAFAELLGRTTGGSELAHWYDVARRNGLTGLRSALMATDEYLVRAAIRYP